MIFIYLILGILLIIGLFILSSKNYSFDTTTLIEVDAPKEHAFYIALDESYAQEWLSSPGMEFVRSEKISGEKGEVGAKLKMIYKRGKKEIEMIETIQVFVPNERFKFDLEDKYFGFTIDMIFEEKEGKTIITEHQKGGGKTAFFNAMMRLFSGKSKQIKHTMYQKLKEIIERTKN